MQLIPVALALLLLTLGRRRDNGKRTRGRVRIVADVTRTSPYRQKRGQSTHKGIDLFAALGSTVRAGRGGLVVASSPDGERSGYGNTVIVQAPDGTAMLYSHMRDTPEVREGELVTAGARLGRVGQTQAPRGPMRSDPHVHVGVMSKVRRYKGRVIANKNSAWVSPRAHAKKHGFLLD